MIVRIANEGQFRLAGRTLDRVDRLDDQLMAAMENNDEAEFNLLLHELVDIVRHKGKPLPATEIVESDLVVPPPDTSFEEARRMFRIGERMAQ